MMLLFQRDGVHHPVHHLALMFRAPSNVSGFEAYFTFRVIAQLKTRALRPNRHGH
jgi:hypothetical protein